MSVPPAPPQPWPAWLPAVTRLHFGIPARKPQNTPSIRAGGWVDLRVWAPFERWMRWLDAGKPQPRPDDVWIRVPRWSSAGELDFDPWKLRRQLLKQRSSTPAPKPSPPPASLFPTVRSPSAGRNGLYFYVWPNGRVHEASLIELARRYQLWICLLVNELDRPPFYDGKVREPGEAFALRDRLKRAGLTVIASGWADPAHDLELQAAAIGRLAAGFDEYMLNIEAAWVWQTPGFAASDIFAPKVRSALGAMPLSLCIDWGNVIHFRPWLEAGASTVRVQCYLNEWPHKTPAGALERLGWDQGDLAGGVPREMREVVYGRYGDGDRDRPLSTWTAPDTAAGGPPRSVWAAEHASLDDILWLAR